MFTDSSINRSCGRRIRGGVYAETRRSEAGLPIEYFIVDPPIPVKINQLGLASVGVQLIEINGANAKGSLASHPASLAGNGVHHIFDVVGKEFYPYPADYVEETRRLVLIHARAVLINFTAYPQPPLVSCPKGIPSHALSLLPEMCAGLWWHDLPVYLEEE